MGPVKVVLDVVKTRQFVRKIKKGLPIGRLRAEEDFLGLAGALTYLMRECVAVEITPPGTHPEHKEALENDVNRRIAAAIHFAADVCMTACHPSTAKYMAHVVEGHVEPKDESPLWHAVTISGWN